MGLAGAVGRATWHLLPDRAWGRREPHDDANTGDNPDVGQLALVMVACIILAVIAHRTAQKRQGVMKRANHLIRKADREGLADLGFSEETIAKLFVQDFAGRAGFPNYTLANNSANIRRLEKRLAVIQNLSTTKPLKSNFLVARGLVDKR